MDSNRFCEYELIIRSVLASIKFPSDVVMYPGNLSENYIYIGSKHRKDCIIEVVEPMIYILLPWYQGNERHTLEVIDKIDLNHPDSLGRLGDVLDRVLSNRI